MNAPVLLGQPLVDDVGQVIFLQGLLEPLLSGGVDSLTHQHRLSSQLHGAGVAADAAAALVSGGGAGLAVAGIHQSADVLRGGAAAASHNSHSPVHKARYNPGELLRGDVVDGAAVLTAGQAGVGVHNEGRAGLGSQHGDDGLHLDGAQAAVHAQAADSQSLQYGDHGLGGGAGEGLGGLVVDGGDKDREAGARLLHHLLGGDDGGLGLVAVVHGFYQHQVEGELGLAPREIRAVGKTGGCHTASNAGANHLGKKLHRPVKAQVTQGLQKLSCRANVQGDEMVAAGGIAVGGGTVAFPEVRKLLLREVGGLYAAAGLVGVGQGGGHNLLQAVVGAFRLVGGSGGFVGCMAAAPAACLDDVVVAGFSSGCLLCCGGELQAVGAKGVGLDDVGSGTEIVVVEGDDFLLVGDIP